nr:MAG TPA: Monocytic leukemia zinc finger protein finger, acetyl transferase, DNA [Caudoviricetes sp.]
MIEKTLYTCQICNTDYSNKADALDCEKNHKDIDSAVIVGVYMPKSWIGNGIPTKLRVKFKGSDEWVVYKR